MEQTTLHMTHKSVDILIYTYILVSSQPSVNYSQVTMNIIDHIYIDILPRSTQASIRQYYSAFVTQQQRDHERSFPR